MTGLLRDGASLYDSSLDPLLQMTDFLQPITNTSPATPHQTPPHAMSDAGLETGNCSRRPKGTL